MKGIGRRILEGIGSAGDAITSTIAPWAAPLQIGTNLATMFRNIWAQDKTWEREDTAVQRRMADLQAAGLSPTLAAGSAAQTGSPMKIEAPDVQQPVQSQYGMYKVQKDIAKTEAQTALLEQQRQRLETVNKYLDEQEDLKTKTAKWREEILFATKDNIIYAENLKNKEMIDLKKEYMECMNRIAKYESDWSPLGGLTHQFLKDQREKIEWVEQLNAAKDKHDQMVQQTATALAMEKWLNSQEKDKTGWNEFTGGTLKGVQNTVRDAWRNVPKEVRQYIPGAPKGDL